MLQSSDLNLEWDEDPRMIPLEWFWWKTHSTEKGETPPLEMLAGWAMTGQHHAEINTVQSSETTEKEDEGKEQWEENKLQGFLVLSVSGKFHEPRQPDKIEQYVLPLVVLSGCTTYAEKICEPSGDSSSENEISSTTPVSFI